MKKTMITLGLISSLSLSILGGAAVFANANSVPAPLSAHHAVAAASTANQEAVEAYRKLLASKSEAIQKTAADLGLATAGLDLKDIVKAIGDKDREKIHELGLTPPPPEDRSSGNQQEHIRKKAAEFGISTEGKSIEDLKKEVHQKELESKADLLKSAAAEAKISTDGRSLEEIQKLLKDYYYAKMEALGIEKPAPRPELAAPPITQAADTSTSANTSAGTTGSNNSEQAAVSVVISGGFDTDPQDKGRPVVLIAAALGVPTEVFREAFRGVTPAGLERGPTTAEAQRNKAALLKVLAPYGITNERLDEVSDYYRYNGSKGGTWPRIQAAATTTVENGVVTGVTITNPGAGYTSNPTVTVTGPNGTFTATAALSYTKDFKTNGSISAITINS